MKGSGALLEGVGGGRIALQGVEVEGTIHDVMSEISLTQTYRNLEQKNIEAVYTFPLAIDAVLLGVEVTLGERKLSGQVIEKKESEEIYEEAVTDGDAAILLEETEPGLYTMSVGNLLPDEKAVITLRYAQPHRWQGEQLRFHLPTTLSPRYGDPIAKGVPPHQVPEVDLYTENRFSLKILVTGLLRKAAIQCPSHDVRFVQKEDCTEITLQDMHAAMDRDFVLTIESPEACRGAALTDRDGENHLLFATFQPEFPNVQDNVPRSLKIVVDCSGSMGGDSIAQAKVALIRIIDSLRPQDVFNIIAFGSDHRMLFSEMVRAEAEYCDVARTFIGKLNADMGGTEIGAALKVACEIPGKNDTPSDLLLITDGEVWDDGQILEEAIGSRHRIFTVGVGSAVAEGFVRKLAEATKGACELVSPRENMAERIVRHFRRIYAPRTREITVDWPGSPLHDTVANIGPVCSGDTVYLAAWFKKKPAGEITLHVHLQDGTKIDQTLPVTSIEKPEENAAPFGALARLAAASRIPHEKETSARRLALDYQLISPWTNFLVVHVREEGEKAEDLPALRKVPHMLSAGWGGAGGVKLSLMPARRMVQCEMCPRDERFELPTIETTPQEFILALNGWFPDDGKQMSIPGIEDLVDLGLPNEIEEELLYLIDEGNDPSAVIISFLYLLSKSLTGRLLDCGLRRIILKEFKAIRPEPELVETVLKQMEEVTDPAWGFAGVDLTFIEGGACGADGSKQ